MSSTAIFLLIDVYPAENNGSLCIEDTWYMAFKLYYYLIVGHHYVILGSLVLDFLFDTCKVFAL